MQASAAANDGKIATKFNELIRFNCNLNLRIRSFFNFFLIKINPIQIYLFLENLTEVAVIPNPLFTVKTENDQKVDSCADMGLNKEAESPNNAISDNSAISDMKCDENCPDNINQAPEDNENKVDIKPDGNKANTVSLKIKQRENDIAYSKSNKWPKV